MSRFIKVTTEDREDFKVRLNIDHIVSYSMPKTVTEIAMESNVQIWAKETPEEIDKLIADAATGNATDQMIGRLRCESCWNYKARQDGLKTETLDLLGELQRLMRNGLLDFLKT